MNVTIAYFLCSRYYEKFDFRNKIVSIRAPGDLSVSDARKASSYDLGSKVQESFSSPIDVIGF